MSCCWRQWPEVHVQSHFCVEDSTLRPWCGIERSRGFIARSRLPDRAASTGRGNHRKQAHPTYGIR